MRSLRVLILCIVSTALICMWSIAAAQSGTRVSTADARSVLRADALIQSATKIGGTVIVVWGSTAVNVDSTLSNLLLFQLYRNGQPVGQPAKASSPLANPSGFTAVVPFTDRFLILWNDRRAGQPGIYGVALDTGGSVRKSEFRVGSGVIATDSAAQFKAIASNAGAFLLWSDARVVGRGIYGMRFTSQGEPDGAEIRLGDGPAQITTYSAFPGLTLLSMGDGAAYAVRADSRLDSRAIPKGRLAAPFYLNRDTSIAVVERGMVNLYGNLFSENVAYWADATAGGGIIVPQTTLLTRDSSGAYAIIYFTTTYDVGNKITTLGLFGRTFDANLAFRSDGMKRTEPITMFGGKDNELGTAIRSVGCDNVQRVELPFTHYVWDAKKIDYTPYRFPHVQKVNEQGELLYDDTTLNVDCVPDRRIPVARIASDSLSTVVVDIGGSLLKPGAPVAQAAVRHRNIAPGIVERSGELLVGWHDLDASHMVLARWNPSTGRESSIIQLLSPPVIHTEYIGGYTQTIEALFRTSLQRFGGTFAAETFQSRTDVYSIGAGQNEDVQATSMIFDLPTGGGWRSVSVVSGAAGVSRSTFRNIAQAYDPNTGELTTRVIARTDFGSIVRTMWWMFGIDRNGGIAWSLDSTRAFPWTVAEYPALIPLEPRSFLVANDSAATRVRDGDSVASFTFSEVRRGAVYQRLLGLHFLRYYFTDTTERTLELELYTPDGDLSATGTASFEEKPRGFVIVQNPIDSSLALVRGGTRGIHLTTMDRQLATDLRDVPAGGDTLAENPAATFHNDSLVIVWEDYREGIPQIYGTARPMRTATVSVSDDERHTSASGSDIISMTPNPARTAATISFIVHGAATLQIVDALGTVVAGSDYADAGSGPQFWTPDVSGLASGTYTVVLRTGGNVQARRLAIAR